MTIRRANLWSCCHSTGFNEFYRIPLINSRRLIDGILWIPSINRIELLDPAERMGSTRSIHWLNEKLVHPVDPLGGKRLTDEAARPPQWTPIAQDPMSE